MNRPCLSQSFLNQIEDIKIHRPEKYQHQILGGWLNKAEGVIFNNWSIGEFVNCGTVVFGQDYGFSKDPSTLIETSIDKANRKIYIRLHFYLQGLTTTQLFELNKQYAGDNLIVADSAEPRLINELRAKGLNILEAVKGAGSITHGIAILQDYDLIIDPNSIELHKELNNYSWLDKKSNTPIDDFNHAIDPIRYATTYQLENPNRGNYAIY